MQKSLDQLRLELAIKAKHGLDFILAACLVWLAVGFIWTLSYSSYNKSIMTFVIGSVLLPLAFLLSKVLKTQWTIKDNMLDPLGLWLNFAQLFYFPFLVFILLQSPDYFIMTYAIITGAHFFPYAWYYHETAYAVMAGLISAGSLLLGLFLPAEKMYLIPFLMSGALLVMAGWLWASYQRKLRGAEAGSVVM